jgi:hypothetical protein
VPGATVKASNDADKPGLSHPSLDCHLVFPPPNLDNTPHTTVSQFIRRQSGVQISLAAILQHNLTLSLGGQRVVGSIILRLVPTILALEIGRPQISDKTGQDCKYTLHYTQCYSSKDTRSPNLPRGRNRRKKRLYLCCTTVATCLTTSAKASLSHAVAYSVIFLSIDHSLATTAACSPCWPASTSRISPRIGRHCRHYWTLSSRGPCGLALSAARPAAALHHRYRASL